MSNLSLDFNRYKPKQPYTFQLYIVPPKVDESEIDKYNMISNAVVSVTIPKVPIQIITDDSVNFGITRLTIPIHDVDSKELKVVFEETDSMLITSTFAPFIALDNTYKDVWTNPDFVIGLTYFNEYKIDNNDKTGAETVDVYHAIVKDIQHPTFNRNGNVDKIDITVTFKVIKLANETYEEENGQNVLVYYSDLEKYEQFRNSKFNMLNYRYYNGKKASKQMKAEPGKGITPPKAAPPEESKKAESSPGAQEKQEPKTSDNKPNSGSGRSKKDFPKLKILTNNDNYRAKKAAGDDNYFNNTASYYGTIYKAYKEWLAANNKQQDIKSAREFLIGSGVLGKTYDDKTCHMCAAGTNLQMSLAADVSKYTSYGNGADYAGNFAKAHNLPCEKIEIDATNWVEAQKKLKELCSTGQYAVSLEYQKGQYGHAFTIVDGVSMSDYQHSGVAGTGVKGHGGCKSITITKIA